MNHATALPHAAASAPLPRALWALMAGNFVIGTGVMVVPGTLMDISASLGISIPQAGQLITAAAIRWGWAHPCLRPLWLAGTGAVCSRFRCFGTLCALAPNYAALLPLRVLAVISPAIFTPQAAASVGLLVSPAQRGRAVTFVFLGWSMASVMGMPLSAWIGNGLGWRWAFALVAVMALASAFWVWRAMPNGIRPAALSRKSWGATLGSAVLIMAVGVTLLMSFAQFVLLSYFAPYFVQTLGMGGGALSLMFLWFGAFGFLGNVVVSRYIDQIGAPRAVLLMMGAIVLSLLLWPLGRLGLWQQALVLVPWAIGCFAANSAHQAPELASATVALNTSAMYAGQGLGAALGGVMIAQGQM
ncbi:MAG: putative MFS family arabinose efflux permease, partial [Hydrogenophaga sp.]